MNYRVAVGAYWPQVRDGIDGVLLSDSRDGLEVMDVNVPCGPATSDAANIILPLIPCRLQR